MMLMPANNKAGLIHYLAGRHPGRIGLLISPLKKGWSKGKPPFYMPYALDNGCFIEWNEAEFYKMLHHAKLMRHKPMWVCVPDVVGDAEATIKQWAVHKNKVKSYGFELAFVAQDGMEPVDVPKEAYCVFIGGTTQWKLNTAEKFYGVCKWLHIGRVNSLARLTWAEMIGADSVDGTGWMRARDKKYYDFIRWFEGDPQLPLFK